VQQPDGGGFAAADDAQFGGAVGTVVVGGAQPVTGQVAG
jgi:hypothetical protein